MEANRKELEVEIAHALARYPSMEMEDGVPMYYLHVRLYEDMQMGFVATWRDADVTFKEPRHMKVIRSIDDIYDTETLKSSTFRQVVSDLADDVEEWLKEL